jgi:hypothetical protein
METQDCAQRKTMNLILLKTGVSPWVVGEDGLLPVFPLYDDRRRFNHRASGPALSAISEPEIRFEVALRLLHEDA